MAGWLGGWVAGWLGGWVAGRLEPPPPPDRNPPTGVSEGGPPSCRADSKLVTIKVIMGGSFTAKMPKGCHSLLHLTFKLG